MLYQSVIAVLMVVFAVNLILNLRSLKRPDRNRRISKPEPLVSVLIPARNEEQNIKACLESVRKQDYPNFEVVVLDDNSVDRTYRIVERMAVKDKRIRLIRGQPLPRGGQVNRSPAISLLKMPGAPGCCLSTLIPPATRVWYAAHWE